MTNVMNNQSVPTPTLSLSNTESDALTLARFLSDPGFLPSITANVETSTERGNVTNTRVTIVANGVELLHLDVHRPEIMTCGACGDDDEIEWCDPRCEDHVDDGFDFEISRPNWATWSPGRKASWFGSNWS